MAPQDDVGKLAKKLREEPKFRAEFRADPEEALKNAGINKAAIPDAFIDVLHKLDGPTLDTVMDVNSTLDTRGLTGDSHLAQFPV
jgi:hypothetical protein